MKSIADWLSQLRLDAIWETLLIVAASLLCITVHETCHGWAAYWQGDDTAKRMGRLSFNPLHHVDWVGLLMMALVRFGWAKPVPVDMRRFRNPRLGMALTALAGPVSNVLLALVALALRMAAIFLALKTGAGAIWNYVILFLEYTALLSAGLAVFNLFPIPPLDGSKILLAVLPGPHYAKWMRYERYGMILLVILLLLNVLDTPLLFLRSQLIDGISWLLTPLAQALGRMML